LKPWQSWTLRIAIGVLVTIGIARSIHQAMQQLEQQQISFWNLSPSGLLGATFFCTLALLPAGVFWRETLLAMGHPLPWLKTLQTYFLGHLGKYIPGKAMVIVIRCGRLHGAGVPIAFGIVSVFVETLYLVAIGSVWGALAVLACAPWSSLSSMAILLAVGALIPTYPPIFRRVIDFLARRRFKGGPALEAASRGLGSVANAVRLGIDGRRCASGWIWMTIHWFLMGCSMWVVAWSVLPDENRHVLYSAQAFGICTAASCLSVVAGFWAMLPGGVGVREWVISMVLVPWLGPAPALATAIWMRIVSLAAELLWILVLYLAIGARTVADQRQIVYPPIESNRIDQGSHGSK
jgi:hypothetical protein